jgi:hypothetical protein
MDLQDCIMLLYEKWGHLNSNQRERLAKSAHLMSWVCVADVVDFKDLNVQVRLRLAGYLFENISEWPLTCFSLE